MPEDHHNDVEGDEKTSNVPFDRSTETIPGSPVSGAAVKKIGGCVNPVPYDLLQDDCDVVVAIDVSGRRSIGEDLQPSYSETLFNTFQIAAQTILSEKIKARPPTILVRPQIEGVRVLEFHKVDQIYEQAAPEQEQLRAELEALIR